MWPNQCLWAQINKWNDKNKKSLPWHLPFKFSNDPLGFYFDTSILPPLDFNYGQFTIAPTNTIQHVSEMGFYIISSSLEKFKCWNRTVLTKITEVKRMAIAIVHIHVRTRLFQSSKNIFSVSLRPELLYSPPS